MRSNQSRYRDIHSPTRSIHGQGLQFDGGQQPLVQPQHSRRFRPAAAHCAAGQCYCRSSVTDGASCWLRRFGCGYRRPQAGLQGHSDWCGRQAGGTGRLHRHRHRCVGRTRWCARQHARVQVRRVQQRGRPGRPDGYAPRRRRVFPVRGQFNPGPDRHQPRIHRRRPAARGRLQQHERREGEEVAERPWPVSLRGRAEGWQLADGEAIPPCAALHDGRAVHRSRPCCRPRDDENRCRPGRTHRAGHAEQLRQQPDALGHLPVGRRKLDGLLWQWRQTHRPPETLGCPQGRSLSMGQV